MTQSKEPKKEMLVLKIVSFKKGRDCYRCGMSKPDIRKSSSPCFSWGTYYDKHIYKTKS